MEKTWRCKDVFISWILTMVSKKDDGVQINCNLSTPTIEYPLPRTKGFYWY
jgi:hypothetical protein